MASSSQPTRKGRVRRIRNKHLEIVGSASTSETSHSFAPDAFMADAEIHRPINTIVERPSTDLRRMHWDVVPIQPPSPIKMAWRGAMDDGAGGVGGAPPPQFALQNAGDERYEMFIDSSADDPPLPPLLKVPRSLKPIFSVSVRHAGDAYFVSDVRQDPTLYTWKEMSRDRYLLELLRLDGRGDASNALCPGCKVQGQRPAYQCRECKGGLLFCKKCCVEWHLENPLHFVEAWDGSRFLRTSLKALGLRIQFGHPPGEYCVNPERRRSGFVALHDNGIHEVTVDYCGPGCENRGKAGAHDTQLLRGGWFPTLEERPQTCMTLVALERFHMETLQAKTTMYDYYQKLQKLMSNDGTKPPDRYQVFIRICRAYRHTMMLKWGGRGHDLGGAAATKSGELAVSCPACPHPGVNLPDDWENALPEQRFIYTLFLALDACFRMKRGMVSSELKDPGLGTGMSYMLKNMPYCEYLLTVTDQKEMSTCSGLAALDYANTKFSHGYSTTGVGMCVCARHEFIQPNGVGDLQKGERFANMDYIFGSVRRHHDPLLRLLVSYDIVCQWWKHLMECLMLLPALVGCILILPMIAFVIPKMHIHAHTLLCGILYSLNLIPGSGQTDGEGIERPWANIGGIASSTRRMGPGARHDMMDDHWGHWNWQKLISLAAMLRRRLDTALEQQSVQREALEAFSDQQKDRAESWRQMVHDYEADPKKKNPYEAVIVGLTETEVHLQFQREEEEEAKKGLPAKHKVMPSAFMSECLDVEEMQREVRVQAELKKSKTASQEVDMSALRTKLVRRLERLCKLQGTYSPASIVTLEKRQAPADEQPEFEPLFLPGALSNAERAGGGCMEGLQEMEPLMRDAQCRCALVKLWNQLVIKSCFLNYKKLHTRHQGATTRAWTIVNRNEVKIRLHSEKYQAAWEVLFANAGRDEARTGWHKLRKDDIRCMEDAEDLRMKAEKRRKAQERRKRKFEELLAHGEDAWWAEEGSDEEDGEQVGERRWDEEVMLLKEEFRRLPLSFEFEAGLWGERVEQVRESRLDEERYSLIWLLEQGRRSWRPKLARGKKQPKAPIIDPLAEATRRVEYDEDDGDDDGVVLAGVDDGDDEEGAVSDEEVVMAGEVDDI
ncbi:CxC2 domain-containing protein [Mycena venus]|uniref:CxC2 domain-containing protein n=1 Tax=Mycena venus TaxID=2733690 RepID=A0A8H6XT12_9AGAR|nr:CxC2 domain-containing protein [Mycena venus]